MSERGHLFSYKWLSTQPLWQLRDARPHTLCVLVWPEQINPPAKSWEQFSRSFFNIITYYRETGLKIYRVDYVFILKKSCILRRNRDKKGTLKRDRLKRSSSLCGKRITPACGRQGVRYQTNYRIISSLRTWCLVSEPLCEKNLQNDAKPC